MRRKEIGITILLPQSWMGRDVSFIEVHRKMKLPDGYLEKHKIRGLYQKIGWWVCHFWFGHEDVLTNEFAIIQCDDSVIAHAAYDVLNVLLKDDLPVFLAR